jgi:hypothetical protein
MGKVEFGTPGMGSGVCKLLPLCALCGCFHKKMVRRNKIKGLKQLRVRKFAAKEQWL